MKKARLATILFTLLASLLLTQASAGQDNADEINKSIFLPQNGTIYALFNTGKNNSGTDTTLSAGVRLRYDIEAGNNGRAIIDGAAKLDGETPRLLINKAYYTLSTESQDVLIGKFFLSWGVLDFLSPASFATGPKMTDELSPPASSTGIKINKYINDNSSIEVDLLFGQPSSLEYYSPFQAFLIADAYDDVAIKEDSKFGNFDLGIRYSINDDIQKFHFGFFNGTSKLPRYVFNIYDQSIIKRFTQATQLSAEYERSVGSLTFRAEGAAIYSDKKSGATIATGIEYWPDSVSGLTIIGEYALNLGALSGPFRVPLDLVLGSHYRDQSGNEYTAGIAADTQNLEKVFMFGFNKKFDKSSISMNAYYIHKDTRDISSTGLNASNFLDYIAFVPTSRVSKLPSSISIGQLSSVSDINSVIDSISNDHQLKSELIRVAQISAGRELNIVKPDYIFSFRYTYSF